MGRARGTKRSAAPGRWPPELLDLQRRGGMAPDWHEAWHERGQSVPQTVFYNPDENTFLFSEQPGQFRSLEDAKNHTDDLPVLRIKNNTFYIESTGSASPILNAEQAHQMLLVLEKELGQSGEVPSWKQVCAGTIDWSGEGMGFERMAPGNLHPHQNREEVLRYTLEWLGKMEAGDSIWMDRNEEIRISKTSESFTIDGPDGYFAETQISREAAEIISDLSQDHSLLLGAEWIDGTQSLIGRYGTAEAYVGGSIDDTHISISSQKPQRGIREKSLVLRVSGKKLEFPFQGEGMSKEEVLLFRNILKSITRETDTLLEHGQG